MHYIEIKFNVYLNCLYVNIGAINFYFPRFELRISYLLDYRKPL